MTFGRLSDLIDNGRALNVNKALRYALDRDDIKDYIIELNTNEQLFNEGENSEGILLEDIGGGYSQATINGIPGVFEGKISLGLPTDRITLYQTGKFYSTFKVKIGATAFTIYANTIKDGIDLQDRWGKDILGLTDESLWELGLEIISGIREYLIDQLLK